MMNLLSRAVTGKTKALDMAEILGKICVSPRMRKKVSRKSQTAGHRRVEKGS